MSREVLKQALDALESFQIISEFTPALAVHAIAALRAELAKPEQIDELWCEYPSDEFGFARAIEAAHGIKEKTE